MNQVKARWSAAGFLFYSIVLGILSTLFLDLWNLLRAWLLDVPLTNYGLIGRWLLYMLDGQFVHQSIRGAAPRGGELLAGWAGHYAISMLFAMLLLAIWGRQWLRSPRLLPAMWVALVTCFIPYFLMQPGMGAGIAGSLTPDPFAARMKVFVSHVVFGVGLYWAGWLVVAVGRWRKG